MRAQNLEKVQLTGPQKTAILFLCMGEEHGSKLMQNLDDTEIYALTQAISDIGEVPSDLVDVVLQDFETDFDIFGSGVHGSIETAKLLLRKILPDERVDQIFSKIDGDTLGENVWTEVSKLPPSALASFIQRESPQTSAVILARLENSTIASVLEVLESSKAADLIQRMYHTPEIPKILLTDIEENVRHELLNSDSTDGKCEMDGQFVEIFGKLDQEKFEELSAYLDVKIPDELARIRKKMFIFDDFLSLSVASIANVVKEVDRTALPLALRGAKKEIRDHFLSSLPQRPREMLKEEMEAMGPVKSKSVKEAQIELVSTALRLASENKIDLPSSEDANDEVV